MIEILRIVLLFFIAFMACHYFLAQVWNNITGRLVTAILFAVLVAVLSVPLVK